MSEYTQKFKQVLSVAIPVFLLILSHFSHSKSINDLETRVISLENDPTMAKEATDLMGKFFAPAPARGANGPKQKTEH